MTSATQAMSSIKHIINIILYRASAELRAEASRTYAGYLWWIIQPLCMFGVYYFAFGYVIPAREENFALFLFTGIILWQWFSVTALRCSGTLIASRALMQQVHLPKLVFPSSVIVVNTVKFSVSLVLLIVVLLIAGYKPHLNWLYLPALLLVELLIIASLGFFSAMLSPFIPDYQYILATILHLLFFVSGIIYDLSILPADIQFVLELNPMAIIIAETRSTMMLGTVPSLNALAIAVAQSTFLLVLSACLLQKFDKTYPKLS